MRFWTENCPAAAQARLAVANAITTSLKKAERTGHDRGESLYYWHFTLKPEHGQRSGRVGGE